MPYIVLPLKLQEDVNAARVVATTAYMKATYEEAEQEAKELAMKHNKQYYVLYIECVASKDTIVAVNDF